LLTGGFFLLVCFSVFVSEYNGKSLPLHHVTGPLATNAIIPAGALNLACDVSLFVRRLLPLPLFLSCIVLSSILYFQNVIHVKVLFFSKMSNCSSVIHVKFFKSLYPKYEQCTVVKF
jgi:hypothetical protein